MMLTYLTPQRIVLRLRDCTTVRAIHCDSTGSPRVTLGFVRLLSTAHLLVCRSRSRSSMNWSSVRYLRLPVCVVVLQPLVQNCLSLRVRHLARAFASARDRLLVVRDRLSHKGCSSAVTVPSPSPAAVPSSPPLLSAAVPSVPSLAPSFLPSAAPPGPSVPPAG